MRYGWRMTLLVFVMIAAQSVLVAQDRSTFIAFVGKRGENEDIFLTTQDNSITYNLTNARSRDWHPTWAHDGARIAFSTDRDGNNEIYMMEANGQNPRNLTLNPASDTSPDWSPMADEIVFVSDRDGGFDLYVLNIADGLTRRLTTDAQPKSDPDWSPDGTRIVYWELVGDAAQLNAVDADTGEITPLLEEGQNQWPAWSPSGTQIAFFSSVGEGNAAVRLLDLASNGITDLLSFGFNSARPDWSPDGSQIAFMSDRDGNFNIYLASADGLTLTRLTSNAEDDTSPAWQPQPADLDFSNTALGQGVNVVQGTIDPALQVALGPGDATIYAPEVANPEDIITVRLQLDPQVAAGAPQPTPDLPARDPQAVEVYRFMGARLILFGGDLGERFDVYPNPTAYVIQIQEDGENYWEWMLAATGDEALGINRFIIELYLPAFEQNGAVIETRIASFNFQIEVGAEEVTPPEHVRSAIVPETPEIGVAVEYSGQEALSIIFLDAMDTNTMVIVGRRQPFIPTQDFESLTLSGGQSAPGQCFSYILASATPVLSRDCQNEDEGMVADIELTQSDVFWFNRINGGIQDVTIQFNGKTYVCPAELAPMRCEF